MLNVPEDSVIEKPTEGPGAKTLNKLLLLSVNVYAGVPDGMGGYTHGERLCTVSRVYHPLSVIYRNPDLMKRLTADPSRLIEIMMSLIDEGTTSRTDPSQVGHNGSGSGGSGGGGGGGSGGGGNLGGSGGSGGSKPAGGSAPSALPRPLEAMFSQVHETIHVHVETPAHLLRRVIDMSSPTKNSTRRIPRTRRAFTLIEVLMAATLGAVVAGACFGLFATIQRADAKSKERTASVEAMSRLHRTLQKTLRTILLDLPRPPMQNGAPAPDAGRTRVSLTEASDGMQRLEVTLSQPPILGLIAGKPVDPITRYQPVRGVFEMRRPVTTASLRSGEQTPIELWWTPYVAGTDTPIPNSSVKVADSMQALQFRFAKTNDQKRLEKMANASFADWGQIPAYVEVQVQTVDGNKAQWMFEVSGSTGMEPGQNQADADLPAALVQRYRGVVLAAANGGNEEHNASGGTNSSSGQGRDTASSGSSSDKPSTTPTGGPDGTTSGSSSGSGSSSNGSSSGSNGSSSSSGGSAGNGRDMTHMSIGQLIEEFYRRLAERDGYTYDPNDR
ncbi:MAG: prepilin-type N-terminal cleavage/methylation domain-containing protein [Phycisphaerales bacterium]